MKILTINNEPLELNDSNELIDDVHFSILDNSVPDSPDFFFEPLIFLETFNSPAVVLKINGIDITIPSDWKIVIGDSSTGNDLEIMPVTSIYKREFEAFVYNPLSSFRPDFGLTEFSNIFYDIKWYCPKLKNNQLLTVPLDNTPQPRCVFFGRDISKQCEIIKYTELP